MAPLRVRLIAGVAFVVFCALLFEMACWVYALAVVRPQLEEIRGKVRHFYRASDHPGFGYELRPEIDLEVKGRRLLINSHGIREASDDLFEDKRRIALFGDSVTFGLNHTQNETISGRLQRRLDPDASHIKVLNVSVPGYGLNELTDVLRLKDRIYHFTDVIFLLNLNDYSRRDSIYEGADNGTYRIYVPPKVMTPYFLRKAVYRLMKGARFASPRWYRWMYEGNTQMGQQRLREMSNYLAERDASFTVLILPSGVSYMDGHYRLADIHAEIGGYLDSIGVPTMSPVDELGVDIAGYFDSTDHFLPAGNEAMAELLEEYVRSNLLDDGMLRRESRLRRARGSDRERY